MIIPPDCVQMYGDTCYMRCGYCGSGYEMPYTIDDRDDYVYCPYCGERQIEYKKEKEK